MTKADTKIIAKSGATAGKIEDLLSEVDKDTNIENDMVEITIIHLGTMTKQTQRSLAIRVQQQEKLRTCCQKWIRTQTLKTTWLK
jgi:hypothetical protein